MMADMEQHEIVDAVEEMRDDPEAWGEIEVPEKKPRAKSERRQRGVVVSVRLTESELQTLQTKAEANGETISGYLRSTGLNGFRNDSRRGYGMAVAANVPGTDELRLLRYSPGIAFGCLATITNGALSG